MNLLFSFATGLLFGIGLIISGMANPAKVIGFLDLAGSWNPSLAFVMGGAIAVGVVGFRLVRQKSRAWFGDSIQLPTARHIDTRLVLGAALFGIGWGIAGICPGPALVLLGTGTAKGIVFVLAMLAGMLAFELWERVSKRPH